MRDPEDLGRMTSHFEALRPAQTPARRRFRLLLWALVLATLAINTAIVLLRAL